MNFRTLFAASIAIAFFFLVSPSSAQGEAPEPGDAGAPLAPATPAPVEASLPAANQTETPNPAPPTAAAPFDDEGNSGPPTAAGTTGTSLLVKPGLEIFAQYTYRNARAEDGGRSWYHEFDLPRVHGSLDAEMGDVRARILLEGVRSAGAGSLVGVASNSVVIRVREAYAAYKPFQLLEICGGMVPTFTVPELDGTAKLRPVTISPLEGNQLASPADLGAGARFTFPKKYGFFGLGLYNGDGYASPELNRGKSIEVAGEIHPAPGGPLLPFGLFVSYVNGSTGAELSRSDRLTGLVVWQGKRVRAGAGATYAWGIGGNGIQEALLVDGFVRAEPVNRLLLGARATHFIRDTSITLGDALTTLTGTVGYRLADPVESFFAIAHQGPSDFTRAIVPGSDFWEARVVTRVVF